MDELQTLLLELDKLKAIYRRSYLSDRSRKENSAEHSWHLAIALLAVKDILPADIRLDHAIRMALVHDVCEIGAGDISVYDDARSQKTVEESAYITKFAAQFGSFGEEVAELWQEFEDQKTKESVWVKVVDRLLPILLNLATEGLTWRDGSISRSQVLSANRVIFETSPELGKWLLQEIDIAVQNCWLEKN